MTFKHTRRSIARVIRQYVAEEAVDYNNDYFAARAKRVMNRALKEVFDELEEYRAAKRQELSHYE